MSPLRGSRRKLLNHVLILKQPSDTHFSRFQNHLGLATLIFGVSKIDWAWRHSFFPFLKSFGPSDTLFGHFQNRLGLATLIFAVFKIIWALRHSILPFSKSFWPRDNHLGHFQTVWALILMWHISRIIGCRCFHPIILRTWLFLCFFYFFLLVCQFLHGFI